MNEQTLAQILKELEELREIVDLLLEDYFKRNPPEEE